MEAEKRKNQVCPRCGYSLKGQSNLTASEKIENKNEIGVLSEEDTQVLPVVGEKCKKCGNKEAFFWTVQQRAADEAEVRFFRCTKCKHTWREYR
ncbi:MAG: transcription factor S [Nanoarchaeota archaeon]